MTCPRLAVRGHLAQPGRPGTRRPTSRHFRVHAVALLRWRAGCGRTAPAKSGCPGPIALSRCGDPDLVALASRRRHTNAPPADLTNLEREIDPSGGSHAPSEAWRAETMPVVQKASRSVKLSAHRCVTRAPDPHGPRTPRCPFRVGAEVVVDQGLRPVYDDRSVPRTTGLRSCSASASAPERLACRW